MTKEKKKKDKYVETKPSSAPPAKEKPETLTYIADGVKQTFHQAKDGKLVLVKSTQKQVKGPRHFRLKQIPTDLRKSVKRRTLKRLRPAEKGIEKEQFYKWFQENIYGQKRVAKKENTLLVDAKTAIDLEMQSDVFEEVFGWGQ